MGKCDRRDGDVAIMVITENRLTYQALEFPISTDDSCRLSMTMIQIKRN